MNMLKTKFITLAICSILTTQTVRAMQDNDAYRPFRGTLSSHWGNIMEELGVRRHVQAAFDDVAAQNKGLALDKVHLNIRIANDELQLNKYQHAAMAGAIAFVAIAGKSKRSARILPQFLTRNGVFVPILSVPAGLTIFSYVTNRWDILMEMDIATHQRYVDDTHKLLVTQKNFEAIMQTDRERREAKPSHKIC